MFLRDVKSISFYFLRLTIGSFTDIIFPSYVLIGISFLSTLLSAFSAQIFSPFIIFLLDLMLDVTENCVHLRKLIRYLVHVTIYARPIKYPFFPVLIPAPTHHYLVPVKTIYHELLESILMAFWGTKKICIMKKAPVTHLKEPFFQK